MATSCLYLSRGAVSLEEGELGWEGPLPLRDLRPWMRASDPAAVPGPPPVGNLQLLRAGKGNGSHPPSFSNRASIEMDDVRPDPPSPQERRWRAGADLGNRTAKDNVEVVYRSARSIDKSLLEEAHLPSPSPLRAAASSDGNEDMGFLGYKGQPGEEEPPLTGWWSPMALHRRSSATFLLISLDISM